MTLTEYKRKFESDLEEIWNDSARFKYFNWGAFVNAMYRSYKLEEEEGI
tara:strand:+ start:1989 stop:2135 length:147 start_codon:yes stop_codon:yes gene_type:complete